MSDTIYEEFRPGGFTTAKGELLECQVKVVFTRFWKGEEDGVQITIRDNWVTMSISEFREVVKAIEKNVEETKDAWWHDLPKKKEIKK